ncbi:MAG TPA: serine/threonine-protein kinase [Nannocystaceae bacterium]|nr:serine/threonine-protein kinase [Nannocystaceae bacterium]
MSGLSELPSPGAVDANASPGVDSEVIAAIVKTRLFEEQPYRIGRFAVLERLGAGGMGVVYAAFDAELDRRVAIKLLFAGADDRGRLAREAQIMARLNHPNVAQIYEVGRHGDGTYVAMEHVRGRTLRAWATQRDPTLRERLSALVQAGRGLAAAHAAGVIHRDFKPDNVMMGDDGRVRVLDFGLAYDLGTDEPSLDDASGRDHATLDSRRPTVRSTATRAGTPAYMAPEQWRGETIDARADVYAFCLTAWEILTGRRPFAELSIEELRRDGGAQRELVAATALPRRIDRVLRRGLAGDREARPPSVDAVLLELARDPAVARTRLLVFGGCVATIVGVIGWQRAEALQRTRACANEAAVVGESWNAGRGDALATAFADTGLAYAPDAFARARTRIDTFASAWSAVREEVCLAEAPIVGATACLDDAHTRLQVLLDRMATPDPAIVQLAVSAAVALPDPRGCADPRSASLHAARAALPLEDRRRLVEIDVMLQTAAYEDALAAADALIDRSERAAAAPVQLAKGDALRLLGRHAESREAAETAYYDAGAAGDDVSAMNAAIDLVDVVGLRLAQNDRAREWERAARMYIARLGLEDNPAVAALDSNVGMLLEHVGESDGSLASHRRALEMRERIYGPDHPTVASSWAHVGVALANRGGIDEGLAAFRRSLAIFETAFGPDHPEVARVHDTIGQWQTQRGQYEEAMASFQRALAMREAVLGPDHESVGETVMGISAVDLLLGHNESALAGYRRALEIAEASFAPDHPRVAGALVSLARAYEVSGDTDTAEQMYRRALAVQERAVGAEDARLAPMLANLGILLLNNREYDEAATLLRRAEQITAKRFGPDNADRAIALGALAAVETSRKRPEAAIELLEEALRIMNKVGLGADQRADVEFQLARAMAMADRDLDQAMKYAEAAAANWRAAGAAKAEYVGYAEALIGAIANAQAGRD